MQIENHIFLLDISGDHKEFKELQMDVHVGLYLLDWQLGNTFATKTQSDSIFKVNNK